MSFHFLVNKQLSVVNRDLQGDQVHRIQNSHVSVLQIERATDYVGRDIDTMRNNILKIQESEDIFFAINDSGRIADGGE